MTAKQWVFGFLEEILFFIICLFNSHGKPCFHILNPIVSLIVGSFQEVNIMKYSRILVINLILLGFFMGYFLS